MHSYGLQTGSYDDMCAFMKDQVHARADDGSFRPVTRPPVCLDMLPDGSVTPESVGQAGNVPPYRLNVILQIPANQASSREEATTMKLPRYLNICVFMVRYSLLACLHMFKAGLAWLSIGAWSWSLGCLKESQSTAQQAVEMKAYMALTAALFRGFFSRVHLSMQ